MGVKTGLARLKNPRVLIPLIIVILILTAFIMAIRNLNSPAEGTIINPPSNIDSSNDAAGVKSYSNSYLSFSYPAKYVMAPATKQRGHLDTVSLTRNQPRDQFVAIDLYNGSLTDDPGISFRNARPDTYKRVTGGDNNIVFQKNDLTEYTGYISHGSMVLSVSFTAVSPYDFNSEYKTIAGSLKWSQ